MLIIFDKTQVGLKENGPHVWKPSNKVRYFAIFLKTG